MIMKIKKKHNFLYSLKFSKKKNNKFQHLLWNTWPNGLIKRIRDDVKMGLHQAYQSKIRKRGKLQKSMKGSENETSV